MSYSRVQSLLNQSISRPTLFQMIVPIGPSANSQLEFMCKTASVPEVRMNTIAVNGHESMGVVREQGTQVVYGNPFTITVISDRDYIVYEAMRTWFSSMAINANPIVAGSQKISYYDTVKRSMTLIKLEQGGGENYHSPFRIRFNNAFPVAIGEIALDTSSYDSFVEFTVDFAYETYTFIPF